MKIARFLDIASNLSGKKSPSIVLAENDAFLRSFPKCAAVLDKLAAGKLFPTPALANVLLILSRETDPVAAVKVRDPKLASSGKVKAAKVPAAPKAEKRYTIIVQANKGWEVVEVLGADTFGEASRKACNRIYAHGGSDTFAEIIADGITTKVTYSDALSHVFAAPLGGKQSCLTIVTSGKMQSVKNYISTFSHG